MNVERYFEQFYAGTKDPSLKAMKYFMEELGYPEKDLKFIHIAGTNGKGSITEMLSNILLQAGYRTGKFMSPHLIRVNERISINHQDITDEEIEGLILELAPKIEKYSQIYHTPITLFELQTTMALLYFYRKNCDFVVLETGLGGLYDCTNIVDSMISIIGSIGYDHMNILGNTLSEITAQKAGIIKKNAETIFVKQEEEVNEIVERTCQEKSNKLHEIEPNQIAVMKYGSDFTKFNYQSYNEIEINLKGEKQPQNTAICLECMEILKRKGYTITDTAIRKGLKNVIHKGRFEIICESPQIIFDGAHNEPAINHLKNNIERYYKNARKVFVISILQTKDYTKILQQILQEEAIFIFTSGNEQGKYVAKEELYDIARTIANSKELYKQELRTAIQMVRKEYRDCVTFVIGSFYVYRTVMEELEKEKDDKN